MLHPLLNEREVCPIVHEAKARSKARNKQEGAGDSVKTPESKHRYSKKGRKDSMARCPGKILITSMYVCSYLVKASAGCIHSVNALVFHVAVFQVSLKGL